MMSTFKVVSLTPTPNAHLEIGDVVRWGDPTVETMVVVKTEEDGSTKKHRAVRAFTGVVVALYPELNQIDAVFGRHMRARLFMSDVRKISAIANRALLIDTYTLDEYLVQKLIRVGIDQGYWVKTYDSSKENTAYRIQDVLTEKYKDGDKYVYIYAAALATLDSTNVAPETKVFRYDDLKSGNISEEKIVRILASVEPVKERSLTPLFEILYGRY